MSLERANERRAKAPRLVKLPGDRNARRSDQDPLEIAKELRAKSRLGQREAKLEAAERK